MTPQPTWTIPCAPPLSAAQARYALLAVFFFGTTLELLAPLLALLALNMLSSFFIFLWYCRDRDATGRKKSLVRNIGVILAPFVAIPWYLVRGAPRGGKIRALLRFAGFLGAMAAAALSGAVFTALIAGLLGIDFAPVV